MKTIFRTIESNTSRYLDFLCDICAFEATAYDKETLDMMANYIAIFAKDEEFWVERVSFE